jgi:hypothetical protein
MTIPKQDIVFISCGQYRKEEIELGKALAEIVTELTPFEGYFAQNQSSLDGLSQNIFRALNRARGFVAVMHHRGLVRTPRGEHTRASVWVEQEIAVAAFLKQALDRDLPVVVYIQKGIHREGVRDQLLLGAVEFETEAEIIADFRARIVDGQFGPMRQVPPKDVDLQLGFRTISRGSGAVHQYRLYVAVKNTGLEPLTDYWTELTFPKAAVLNPCYIVGTERDRETATHTFIRLTRAHIGSDLYPGDTIETMKIDYHMEHDRYWDGSILDLWVRATFGSPGMTTKRVEKLFRELQEF